MNLGTHVAAACAALLLQGVVATSADAQTAWKYSSWTAPNAPNNRLGTIPLFEHLSKATNGSFTVQNFMGSQLFNNRTTLKGVSDATVDGGVIVPAFTPAELKHNAIITDAPALFTDGWASTGAANEALFFNCPECRADFDNNKTITLGVYSPGQNYMQCVDDIKSIDDLRGKKVAGVSTMTARWAEVLSQARQQIGPGDLLPALQRRQVDCTMSPLEFLFALSLKDVVKSVVEMPLGAFPAVHLMVVNKASWSKLSDAHKAALIKEMAPAIARVVSGYNDDEARARKEATEKGAKFVTLPALDEPWKKFVAAEENVLVDLAKARGVPEDVTKRIVTQHLQLVQKWKGIMDRVGRTEAGLSKALWDEVFSKVKL